ncbi:hypothetical protein SACE_2309 [Saccharopolyspora erythraea NRRL 2338]|uniref:Uncharacterized protein n=1 Tax=Saccharopolyspora erythraea (strain ATCC 11635 / DSM 40517 / JCM 4748 / NBRC 13426 / NCIMB 8594 / NRRL 2338) TaxID=405948 RepID=A4FC35_SACEN|nr:hypothetical protein SACE_2309 [Saccharopolyspora erythraea NRRL 2338]
MLDPSATLLERLVTDPALLGDIGQRLALEPGGSDQLRFT